MSLELYPPLPSQPLPRRPFTKGSKMDTYRTFVQVVINSNTLMPFYGFIDSIFCIGLPQPDPLQITTSIIPQPAIHHAQGMLGVEGKDKGKPSL